MHTSNVNSPRTIPWLSLCAVLLSCNWLACSEDDTPTNAQSNTGATNSGGSGSGAFAGTTSGGNAGANAGTAGSGGNTAGTAGTGGQSGGNAGTGGAGGSSGSSGVAGSGAGGSGGSGQFLDVVWTPCPLDSNLTTGGDAECAQVQVPLRKTDPSQGEISVFVKRKLASTQPARAQLWFLNGGPGYSGADFEPLVKNIYSVSTDIDQYMLDHRGVGRSTRLGCLSGEDESSEQGTNISEGELPSCVEEMKSQWGAKLDGFTTTEASHDLGGLIEATVTQGQQVIVWGGSYGTVWANRYMQLYPTQANAVLLDAPALSGDLSIFDTWFNGLAERFMAACAADAFCASKLGPNPWETLTAAMNKLDNGQCPGVSAMGYNRRILGMIFSSFFYSWDARVVIPALTYRLNRCDDADVAAFEHLANALFSPQTPTTVDGYFSLMLSAHITLSELWGDPPPTYEQLEAYRDTANVTHGLPSLFASVYDQWPLYPHDQYFGQLATYSGPMLITHGEFDFIPMEDVTAVVDQFQGPNQSFVLLPRAPHGTLQSPKTMGNGTCGGNMLLGFILDPQQPIKTECLGLIKPIEFEGNASLNSAYLGTTDLYENAVPTPPSQPQQKLVPTAVHPRQVEMRVRALAR